MSNPDTNNVGIRLMLTGEFINLWGDPYLNNDLKILSNLASKTNAIVLTGDYTPNDTNYSTSNDTEAAIIKVSGTLGAAANFVLPSRFKSLIFWNTATKTVTAKCAASTGTPIPSNGIALLSCDGVDVYNNSPTHAGTSTQASDTNAYALWGAVQTAIATAVLPAASGTLFNSATDTTPGYLNQKESVSGSFLIQSTTNPGGNEVRNLASDDGQVSLYVDAFS